MHRYFEINEGGHNIRCKLYYSELKSIRRIVVFCHGFGGHKDNGAAEKFAERLTSKYRGAALVTFNWPAHGDDVKKGLHLADCDAYLGIVLSHLREKYGTDEIYCHATSFGGWLTLKYIHDHGNPFRKIALRCPAVNMRELLWEGLLTETDRERLRKGKEVSVGFDRKVNIGMPFLEEMAEKDIRKREYLDYAEDILILHGTADEVVPFEASRAFAEDKLIEFIAVEGADHRFRHPGTMEIATKAILDFYGL